MPPFTYASTEEQGQGTWVGDCRASEGAKLFDGIPYMTYKARAELDGGSYTIEETFFSDLCLRTLGTLTMTGRYRTSTIEGSEASFFEAFDRRIVLKPTSVLAVMLNSMEGGKGYCGYRSWQANHERDISDCWVSRSKSRAIDDWAIREKTVRVDGTSQSQLNFATFDRAQGISSMSWFWTADLIEQ